MKSAEGKTIRARDGRTGYCISSRPRNKQLIVLVGGREERWGTTEVEDAEICRVMGIRYEV